MSPKKRYITIHIIPDDSSQTWTLRLRYRFFEFLFYAIIIALFAIGFAALKITEINGKVLTAEHLARMNRELIAKQKRMVQIEKELAKIVAQEKRIRGIVETFVAAQARRASGGSHADADAAPDYLQDYVTEVKALEMKRGPRLMGENIPDIWPVAGIVSQQFRGDGTMDLRHEGIDIIAEENALVVCAARGIVTASQWDRDLGKYVQVDHGQYQTVYAHLSRSFVKVGDHVPKGGSLGIVGSTGNSIGPHLHYEILYKGQPTDPEHLLN